MKTPPRRRFPAQNACAPRLLLDLKLHGPPFQFGRGTRIRTEKCGFGGRRFARCYYAPKNAKPAGFFPAGLRISELELALRDNHSIGEQTRDKPAVIPLADIALMLSGGRRIGFPEGHVHLYSAI